MPTFQAEPLTAFAESLFVAAGVPADDARVVSRHLVDANLCGHDSHGVMRVPQYLQFLNEGKYRANVPLDVLNETPAVVAADANWGLGQVQAHRLLAKLAGKAETLGVASGTLRNSGHVGRLGEYAETVAAKGLALIAAVNSHGAGRRVAPPGGREGRISTNPICMGVPTATDPVVLDFGTSVAAEGKVRVHFQKNEPAPAGWLIDAEGQPTTNPAVLYQDPRGTILPFGGSQAYKGFGLGLLLDLLAGGLSGGACSNPGAPLAGIGNTLVFVVLNPALFGGAEHFLNATTGLTTYVRDCPRADGVDRITLPGDPERDTKRTRLATGITIPDGTWQLLVKEAGRLAVPVPA
ncbi:Ldh family oxidoreductase [Limnoglobus roseus]|uniref:Ldh family oxidoreductase n=1 Tax=Limnoglobus roseus TaxID=2598579 RepID=A0A5C1AJ93_9BACT|nr:Ldh family oxidoreductase [Limnoglobus roseus]